MSNQEGREPNSSRQRFYHGYVVVAASFLIMMCNYGIYYSFGIFFKPIIHEFGWTRAMTSGAFSLSWIIHASGSLFIGALYDRFGPRTVITLCGLLAGIGYLLMSQITEIWHLYLVYGVLIGIGSAIFTPLLSTITKLFVKRRTTMVGITTVGIGLGSLIIPIIANSIILTYDWRISFIVLGILVLLVSVSGAQFLRQDNKQIGQSVNDANNLEQNSAESESGVFSFIEAIATRQLWIIFVMIFCFGFCVLLIQVHIVPYATDMGISASNAALILATIGGASILGRIILGGLGDRIGNRNSYIIVFLLMTLSILFLILSKGLWSFYILAFSFGLAYGNGVAQESPLVAVTFGLSSLGSILGFIVFGFGLGAAIGPLVAGYIFDITGSYQIALFIATLMSLIALVLTILLKPIKTK